MDGFGPLVSAAWLVDHAHDDDVAIVDLRWYLDGRSGRDAYEAGHIPGAVWIDLDTECSAPPSPAGGRHPLPDPADFAAAMGRHGIGDHSRVVVYDDMGGVIAARLWWMLDAIGRSAAVLDGGVQGWPGELETGAARAGAEAEFAVAPWPTDRLISTAELLAALESDVVILDGRAPDRYAHGGAVDPRPGHVPGARSAPAGANLADGRFRSSDELAQHYRALGADGPNTVAYCGSGVTACADLLGRRRAGLPDGRLYVGSWSAWGADASLPTEEGPDVNR